MPNILTNKVQYQTPMLSNQIDQICRYAQHSYQQGSVSNTYAIKPDLSDLQICTTFLPTRFSIKPLCYQTRFIRSADMPNILTNKVQYQTPMLSNQIYQICRYAQHSYQQGPVSNPYAIKPDLSDLQICPTFLPTRSSIKPLCYQTRFIRSADMHNILTNKVQYQTPMLSNQIYQICRYAQHSYQQGPVSNTYAIKPDLSDLQICTTFLPTRSSIKPLCYQTRFIRSADMHNILTNKVQYQTPMLSNQIYQICRYAQHSYQQGPVSNTYAIKPDLSDLQICPTFLPTRSSIKHLCYQTRFIRSADMHNILTNKVQYQTPMLSNQIYQICRYAQHSYQQGPVSNTYAIKPDLSDLQICPTFLPTRSSIKHLCYQTRFIRSADMHNILTNKVQYQTPMLSNHAQHSYQQGPVSNTYAIKPDLYADMPNILTNKVQYQTPMLSNQIYQICRYAQHSYQQGPVSNPYAIKPDLSDLQICTTFLPTRSSIKHLCYQTRFIRSADMPNILTNKVQYQTPMLSNQIYQICRYAQHSYQQGPVSNTYAIKPDLSDLQICPTFLPTRSSIKHLCYQTRFIRSADMPNILTNKVQYQTPMLSNQIYQICRYAQHSYQQGPVSNTYAIKPDLSDLQICTTFLPTRSSIKPLCYQTRFIRSADMPNILTNKVQYQTNTYAIKPDLSDLQICPTFLPTRSSIKHLCYQTRFIRSADMHNILTNKVQYQTYAIKPDLSDLQICTTFLPTRSSIKHLCYQTRFIRSADMPNILTNKVQYQTPMLSNQIYQICRYAQHSYQQGPVSNTYAIKPDLSDLQICTTFLPTRSSIKHLCYQTRFIRSADMPNILTNKVQYQTPMLSNQIYQICRYAQHSYQQGPVSNTYAIKPDLSDLQICTTFLPTRSSIKHLCYQTRFIRSADMPNILTNKVQYQTPMLSNQIYQICRYAQHSYQQGPVSNTYAIKPDLSDLQICTTFLPTRSSIKPLCYQTRFISS